MVKLTVTAKGQVTLRREILQHLGVMPGDKIELELLPDGQAAIHAARKSGSIDDFIGFLAGRSDKVATLDEINQAIEDGWAGKVR
jgi:antitoxin PrlF